MVKLVLRISEHLHADIKSAGDRNRRSLNSEILRAIEFYLKNAPEARYDPTPTKEKKPTKKTS